MKPGDILALRVDRILSNEQINNMREELEQIRPDGVKIAILDATCQLQIVEPPNVELSERSAAGAESARTTMASMSPRWRSSTGAAGTATRAASR